MQLSWPVKQAKPLIDSHQNFNQLKVDESAQELLRVGDQTREWELRLSWNCIL